MTETLATVLERSAETPKPSNTCPRCGRRLRYHRDGIFRWKECPARRSCGWSVFDGREAK